MSIASRRLAVIPPFSILPLLVSIAGLSSTLGCQRPEVALPPLENVVLITLDTVRADHLGSYAYPRSTTPFLDELAARGIRFERAFTPSPLTTPAHASILTSLFPEQHRVLTNDDAGLNPQIPTIASVLNSAGHQTAAFLSIEFLRLVAGDFDLVDETTSEGDFFRRAAETVDAALGWLDTANRKSPFFLWVHVYDAHEHRDEEDVPETALRWARSTHVPALEERQEALGREYGLGPKQLMHHLDLYDAQIAFQDTQLRRLFDDLRARGLEDRTLWVVTADHGEALGEHGQVGHGLRVYNEQIHVPLIFYGGPGRWEPATVDRLVRLVDLLPTITELVGVPVDREALRIEGHSLAPLLRDRRAELPVRYTLAQMPPVPEDRPRRAVRAGETSLAAVGPRFKYISNSLRADELYDLVADPGETKNLIAQELEAAERLRAWLDVEYLDLVDDPRGDDTPANLTPERIELLEKLGYL